jgi:hypothetical protein
MIVLIDNYDSFTYNLVQKFGEVDPKNAIKVFRNDKVTVAQIEDLKPTHIVISPGPCTPKAEATIQIADEEAGKRMADAVTGLGDFMKAEVAKMKQAGPQSAEIADAINAFAEAFRPQQSGTKVTVTIDAKAMGGLFKGWVAAWDVQVAPTAPSKGGL